MSYDVITWQHYLSELALRTRDCPVRKHYYSCPQEQAHPCSEFADLSLYARTRLHAGGYFRRATVAAAPDAMLLAIPMMGPKTLAQIRAAIPYQPAETTAQLLTSGPITMTVTPPPGSYTFALAPVLDSDWAYARAQMGLSETDPPPAVTPDTRYVTDRPDVQAISQAPGGVYAQLTALAGHIARLQARLDTQEALLLDLQARVAALEGTS